MLPETVIYFHENKQKSFTYIYLLIIENTNIILPSTVFVFFWLSIWFVRIFF